MRIPKLALLSLAALLFANGSAFAITVKKRTEAPGLPPEIWAIVGDFCAIKTWHPAAADCVVEKDGGKIKEKLTSKDDLSYSYEIVESPLPVKNYKSKLWLELDDEPDRTVIYWQSDFDANGASDDDAKAKITGILADGVKGIKEKAIAAHDAKEAAAGKTPDGDKGSEDDDK